MDNLKNIRVHKFLSLTDEEQLEYHEVLQHLKPLDRIKKKRCKDFLKLKYKEVQRFKEVMESQQIVEAVQMMYGFSKFTILTMRLTQFYQAVNHLIALHNNIIEIETPTPKFQTPNKMKGMEFLNNFSYFNILMALANQFKVKPSDIENWEFSEIISIVKHNEALAYIQHLNTTK